MFSIRIEAEKFLQYMENFTEFFRQSAIDESAQSLGEIRKDMQAPGKPVTYPIDWDSQKQKRYVIAKLSEEGNLPYSRTDQYRDGWKLSSVPQGFALSNAHPAGAVGGTIGIGKPGTAVITNIDNLQTWQSKIHRGRWPRIVDAMKERLKDINKRIVERMSKK